MGFLFDFCVVVVVIAVVVVVVVLVLAQNLTIISPLQSYMPLEETDMQICIKNTESR